MIATPSLISGTDAGIPQPAKDPAAGEGNPKVLDSFKSGYDMGQKFKLWMQNQEVAKLNSANQKVAKYNAAPSAQGASSDGFGNLMGDTEAAAATGNGNIVSTLMKSAAAAAPAAASMAPAAGAVTGGGMAAKGY